MRFRYIGEAIGGEPIARRFAPRARSARVTGIASLFRETSRWGFDAFAGFARVRAEHAMLSSDCSDRTGRFRFSLDTARERARSARSADNPPMNVAGFARLASLAELVASLLQH